MGSTLARDPSDAHPNTDHEESVPWILMSYVYTDDLVMTLRMSSRALCGVMGAALLMPLVAKAGSGSPGSAALLDPNEASISGMVRSVEHPPFGSGIFKVWARVQLLQDATWKDERLFTVYLDAPSLPPVGAHCLIHYHMGIPDEYVMWREDVGRVAKLIDDLHCDTQPRSNAPVR
jgi:hypothetical protein